MSEYSELVLTPFRNYVSTMAARGSFCTNGCHTIFQSSAVKGAHYEAAERPPGGVGVGSAGSGWTAAPGGPTTQQPPTDVAASELDALAAAGDIIRSKKFSDPAKLTWRCRFDTCSKKTAKKCLLSHCFSKLSGLVSLYIFVTTQANGITGAVH